MSLMQWLKKVFGENQRVAVHYPDDRYSPLVRKRLRFSGLVQGIGFRYEAKYTAEQLDLVGWAKNKNDGTVVVEVEGKEVCIDEFLRVIRSVPRFHITEIQTENLPISGAETSFRILY